MDNKLTIIVGTNRLGSNSEKVAVQYAEMAKSQGVMASLIYLKNLPKTFAFSEMYGERSEQFQEMVDQQISNCKKFVFIIPEYNGSFPGVLKAFIDAVPPGEWAGKKVGLVGLSSGKSGALRAMDQFTNVMNYLKASVFHSKPKLSGIEQLLNDQIDAIDDEATQQILVDHIKGIITF